MKVVFRTDASLKIGTGHVMRCLTLADSLRKIGTECIFICRPHIGNLLNLIATRGHQAIALPVLQESASPNYDGMAHADWLGIESCADAADTIQVLNTSLVGIPLDWLVIDHYALDHNWEGTLRPYTQCIMVIDDLANRKHDCDMLLNQNLGRSTKDYEGLVNTDTTTMLIGPQYALLRPEFAAFRTHSLARRAQGPQFKHLLVAMGGVDMNNVTGQLLKILKKCTLPPDLHITVVMGTHSPWLVNIQVQARSMSRPTKVLIGISNIAEIMSESDLALGAAGGMAWERCCLGLSSFVVVVAENQQFGATALQKTGATIALKSCTELSEVLSQLQSVQSMNTRLTQLSNAAAALTDGTGCARVTAKMIDKNHA
jgi:UDP-2,4-diacetamido-2,4,6-trideoxy-beta-L-altropyranose hydrolase